MVDSGFLQGYFNGKFVLVPLKGTPIADISKCRHNLETYGDEEVKGVLDPHSISYTDLKNFCEINDIPISWITQTQEPNSDENIGSKPLYQVIDSFLETSLINTEKTYRNTLDTLQMYGLIDLNQPSQYLSSAEPSIISDIDKKVVGESNKQVCRGFVKSLVKFIDNNGEKKFSTKSVFRKTRRSDTKKQPLTQSEYDQFIRELRLINERDALIAEILWYLNNTLAEGCDFITLDSVLKAQTHDIIDGCSVNFARRNGMTDHLYCINMPDALFQKVLKQARGKASFIFCKSDGGPLKRQQVLKNFKKAGKNAGINRTICLRPLAPVSR